jgi:hypothetical protein
MCDNLESKLNIQPGKEFKLKMFQNFPIYIGKTSVNARPGKESTQPGLDKLETLFIKGS